MEPQTSLNKVCIGLKPQKPTKKRSVLSWNPKPAIVRPAFDVNLKTFLEQKYLKKHEPQEYLAK